MTHFQKISKRERRVLNRFWNQAEHGDGIEIDESIYFEITLIKVLARIIHDNGMTFVDNLSVEELTAIIEIVWHQRAMSIVVFNGRMFFSC